MLHRGDTRRHSMRREWKLGTRICREQRTKGSTNDFKTRTANGSELFSLISCLHTTTFTLLSTFSPLGLIIMKIWGTPLSWHAKCPLPVAVRVSKTRVLKSSLCRMQTRMHAFHTKMSIVVGRRQSRNYVV